MKIKKILKVILIIIFVLIGLWCAYTIRNFTIIKGVQESFKKYESSSNYHIKSVANESENVTMTVDYYKKGDKQVTFMERKINGEIIKVIMYDNGEKVDVFTESNKEKTYRINVGKSSMNIELINYFHTENDWITFYMSAFANIQEIDYKQKKCYIIKNCVSPDILYNEENNEIYIEKDSGLCIKSTMGKIVTEREYEFDNVNDEIFVEPDISQYKMI